MATRSWYQGGGIGLVDDKGRVAIPAPLRQALSANAPKDDGKTGGTVIVGVHQSSKCLIAYDAGYLDMLAAELSEREANHTHDAGERDYNIKRRAAAGEAIPYDGSGRFIMPAFPRFHADITEHAFFYGVFDYIEIWDPRTLIDAPDVPETVVMKKMARFYMAERGIAL